MLFDIREFLDRNSSLRDIADCIHSVRNRGNALSKIENHVDNFLSVAKNSGVIAVRPIYDPTQLITELTLTLTKLGFIYDMNIFRSHTITIIKFISEFLGGTKIDLKNKEVKKCCLELSKDFGLVFCFSFVSDINRALRLPSTVSIAMPFFNDVSK